MTKIEIKRLENAINSEGFDYAFIHYSSFEDIKDEEFHRLKVAYINAQDELQKYLVEQGVEF